MITTQLREGIAETLDILKNMDKIYVEKIPEDFMNFLKQNKAEEYRANLDHRLKINEMDLKEQTKDILTVIYLNYWCNDDEKMEYINLLNTNEQIYQNEINEKYNPDKLFANKNTSTNQELLVVDEKPKTIFEKFITFIKKLFQSKL